MTLPRHLHAALAVGALALAGCGSSSGDDTSGSQFMTNPTGSCTAPDSGSRIGYHSSAGDAWLPDCQCPLKREYWRVFAQSATSAYMIPRPDGAGYLSEPCDNPSHELSELVHQYTLCAFAGSEAEVDRINHMDPADALAIEHYLHGLLRFEPAGSDVHPYALPGDFLDACALRPESNSADIQKACQFEVHQVQTGTEMGRPGLGDSAPAFAALVNEIYGIE